MAECATCFFDPCECCTGSFTIPSANGLGSLVASLAPCVDQLRDLEVCLGARTRIVRMIWTSWSGGERGVGQEMVDREVVLTPLPTVKNVEDLSVELQNIGSTEVGVVELTGISTRYSENFLTGKAQDGTPVPKDQNFYYEIEDPDVSLFPVKRRFTMKGPPDRDDLDFMWKVKLVRTAQDRTPQAGVPRG